MFLGEERGTTQIPVRYISAPRKIVLRVLARYLGDS